MKPEFPAVIDGVLREDAVIGVSVQSGGFSSGEGLFETLSVVRGAADFLTLHLGRLNAAAEELEFRPAPTRAEWLSDLRLLVKAAGVDSLAVRLVLFRDLDRLHRVVSATAMPKDVGTSVKVGRCDPRLDGPRALAAYKTLNYLSSRRAHEWGARAGLDEVIFTRSDGLVLEGTRSSVFAMIDGELRTAPLDGQILPGVTRQILIEEARAMGLPVSELHFHWRDLARASEAFISASVRGLRPILSFEGDPVGWPGTSVVPALAERYRFRRTRDAEALG